MKNETKIALIKNHIELKSAEFGGFENIALTREAYHACNPNRPNGWNCDAIRIDGNIITSGVVSWDFEEDLEDASCYNWEFGQSDFSENNHFDLTDEDDLDELIMTLKFD